MCFYCIHTYVRVCVCVHICESTMKAIAVDSFLWRISVHECALSCFAIHLTVETPPYTALRPDRACMRYVNEYVCLFLCRGSFQYCQCHNYIYAYVLIQVHVYVYVSTLCVFKLLGCTVVIVNRRRRLPRHKRQHHPAIAVKVVSRSSIVNCCEIVYTVMAIVRRLCSRLKIY